MRIDTPDGKPGIVTVPVIRAVFADRIFSAPPRASIFLATSDSAVGGVVVPACAPSRAIATYAASAVSPRIASDRRILISLLAVVRESWCKDDASGGAANRSKAEPGAEIDPRPGAISVRDADTDLKERRHQPHARTRARMARRIREVLSFLIRLAAVDKEAHADLAQRQGRRDGNSQLDGSRDHRVAGKGAGLKSAQRGPAAEQRLQIPRQHRIRVVAQDAHRDDR